MASRKKLGLAGASLLGAATIVGLSPSPAGANDIIICQCEEETRPGGDSFSKIETAFIKIETAFIKIEQTIEEVHGAKSSVALNLDAVFHKIMLKFSGPAA